MAPEVRNALMPAETSLNALYREVLVETPDTVLARRRPAIDTGIRSVFRFLDEILKLASLGATPSEPFDLSAVAGDAVVRMQERTPSDLILTVSLEKSPPPVIGHRERAVLAILNL